MEISLDNLFKILPRGILSKNSFKGAYIKLEVIPLWSFLQVEYTHNMIILALTPAPKAIPRDNIE